MCRAYCYLSMRRPPPISTRTDTLSPYTTLFPSIPARKLRLLYLKLAMLALQGCAGWASWDKPNRRPVTEAYVVPDRMPGPNEYVVRRGDTVYAIAFRHNLDEIGRAHV